MEPYIHPWLVGCLQAPQAKKFLVQVLISGRLGAPLRSARKRLSHAAAAAGQPFWSACSPPGRRRSAPRACAAPRAAPAQGPSGCGPGGRPPRPGCGSLHRSGCGPAQGGARAAIAGRGVEVLGPAGLLHLLHQRGGVRVARRRAFGHPHRCAHDTWQGNLLFNRRLRRETVQHTQGGRHEGAAKARRFRPPCPSKTGKA